MTALPDLAARRRELARRRLAARRGGPAPAPELPPVPDRPVPASAAQYRFWLLDQLADTPDERTRHVLRFGYRFTEPLDPDWLRTAISALVERHRVLRTVYRPGSESRPDQVVLEGAPVIEERAAGADPLAIAEELARPFALDREPPVRFALVPGPDGVHGLAFAVHHVAFDATSAALLLDDLAQLYVGGDPAPAPDYAAWTAGREGTADDLAFWRTVVSGLEPVALTPDRDEPAARGRGTRHVVELPAGLAERARETARAAGTGLRTLLQAAVGLAVAPGRPVGLGTPVDLRGDARAERILGCFVNTITLPTDLTGDPTGLDLLRRLHAAGSAALDHADLPFEAVAAAVRRPDGEPPYRVLLAATAEAPARIPFGPTTVEPLDRTDAPSLVDLLAVVRESRDGGIGLSVTTADDRFSAAAGRLLLDRVTAAFAQLAAAPEERVGAVVLPAGEGLRVAGPPARRAVLLRPDLAPGAVDAAVARCLARHPALRPDGLAAALAAGPLTADRVGSTLHLTAEGLDETSWGPVLAEFADVRATPTAPTAPAPTVAPGEAPDPAEAAEAWLALWDRAFDTGAVLDDPPPARREPLPTRTVRLTCTAPLERDPAGTRRLVVGALADAVGRGLVLVTESDRDRGGPAVGGATRTYPVLLGEEPAAPALAATYTPDPDLPAPPLTLGVAWTDPGDAVDPGLPAGQQPGTDSGLAVGLLRTAPGEVTATVRGTGDPDVLVRFVDALRRSAPAAGDRPRELVTLDPADRARLTAAFGPVEDVLPLSPLQEGLLFHLLAAEPGQDVYVSQTVLRLRGRIPPGTVRAAAEAALRRYPTVRAGFVDVGGRWLQVVPERVRVPWREVDLRAGGDPAAVREEEYRAGFDPAAPPLVRFALLDLPGDEQELVFTAEHLLLDGWSIVGFLLSLLRATTDAEAEAARPVTPFRTYLEWIADQDAARAEEAWATYLAGVGDPCLVAPDAGAVEASSREAEEFTVELGQARSAALTGAARALGATVSTLVEAAWAVVLGHRTGRDDVVFGSVVSGRPPEVDGIDTTVGLLFNTVPVRAHVGPGVPLTRLVATLARERTTALRHPWVSLSRLHRLAGASTLFDTLLVVQNHPRPGPGERFGPTGAELVGTAVRDATHYPFSLVLNPTGTGHELRAMFRTDAVDEGWARDTVGSVLHALDAVCAAALAGTDLPIARVDLGGAPVPDSGPAGPVPERTVADLLTAQAAATPHERAVVANDVELTFAELAERASGVAGLLQARGVGPEHRVVLVLPRSELMVVAMFGVFAAHAAYVPVDREHPPERIAEVVRQAGPTVLLASRETVSALPPELRTDPRTVLLDEVALDRPGAPVAHRGLDHLAYVIFTSGSTGRPKGVAVPYRGLTNMYLNHLDAIFEPVLAAQGGRRLRIAHTTSFAFDASWEQLFWLLAGHEVHVIDEELRVDPDRLLPHFAAQGIDAFDVTPTYGAHLVAHGLLDRTGLVFVSLGGEAVGEDLWTRLRERVAGHNLYGPTEYTINALGADLADTPRPSVGLPIRNTRAHVLDGALRPVPVGLPGELYLSGAGLARGYDGRAALTAERFVAAPSGERMYRTGDIVRRHGDGTLDYLGRSDDQVKIRGFRVEPAEVADAVRRCAGVGSAAVVARPDGDGAPQLVAYVTGVAGLPAPDHRDLRAELEPLLPRYMLPAATVPLDRLPLTVNGKLDAAALPAPGETAPDAATDPPRGRREEAVAAAFTQVLGGVEVGREDDFFAVGGHSLLAMDLVRALRAVLDDGIAVRDLYATPTVAGLAARGADGGLDPVLEISAGPDPVWCLPPAGGLGWAYRGLRVPGRGVRACQQLTADPAWPVPAHADLLGWSTGGVLACTVAARVGARSVVLLDSFADGALRTELAAALGPRVEGEWAALCVLAGVAPERDRDAALAAVRGAAGPFGGLPDAVLDAVAANLAAAEQAPAPVPVGAPVLLVRALRDRTPGQAERQLADWTAALGTAPEVHDVDLDHRELGSPTGWAAVGPRLAEFWQTNAQEDR